MLGFRVGSLSGSVLAACLVIATSTAFVFAARDSFRDEDCNIGAYVEPVCKNHENAAVDCTAERVVTESKTSINAHSCLRYSVLRFVNLPQTQGVGNAFCRLVMKTVADLTGTGIKNDTPLRLRT